MTDTPTAGSYLRLRREAAGLSLDDVAFAIETIPAISAVSRVEWLRQIEAGVAPLQVDVALALDAHPALHFDRDVLFELCARDAGLPAAPPAICRACCCSEWDPCVSEDGEACAGANPEATLCTACAAQVAA